MTIATELTKLETTLNNAYSALENRGAELPSKKNFDNMPTSINSLVDLSSKSFNVTINNKAHQQITAQLEPIWQVTEYNSSFKAGPLNLGIKLHLYIHTTDAGYAHGALSWSPSSFVNGGLLTSNLVVNVSNATPIENVVIPTGYEDYYLYNNTSKFYDDTNYDNYISKSAFPSKVIIFDLVNYLTKSSSISISGMFSGCTALTALDITNLNTSKVTNMGNLFSSCSNLTSLDLSNWDTSSATNMGAMFSNCTALTTVNITGWNTSKVTSMSTMFYGCTALTTTPSLNSLNTSNVTSMERMFYGCTALTTVNLNNLNTSNVTTLSGMFDGCTALTTVNVTGWNTSKVTNMGNMFSSCSKLTSLNLSSWDTSSATSFYNMFYKCSKLTSLNISNWNTSKATSFYSMFMDCSSLTSLNISNWNTSNVTSMSGMFMRAYKLKSLDLSKWNTSKVTDISNMFSDGLAALTALDLSNWDTSKVTSMSFFLNVTSSGNNFKYLIIGSSTFKFQLKSSGINIPSTAKILVPKALLNTFKNATNWSVHASKFDAIENYTITRSNGQVTVTPK